MIITISDMWKNQQKMLDNDNQIKLSSLIVFLAPELKLCIARTGGTIPAGGATERNLCPDQEQPLASRNSTW